jgi:hypothetical protein
LASPPFWAPGDVGSRFSATWAEDINPTKIIERRYNEDLRANRTREGGVVAIPVGIGVSGDGLGLILSLGIKTAYSHLLPESATSGYNHT